MKNLYSVVALLILLCAYTGGISQNVRIRFDEHVFEVAQVNTAGEIGSISSEPDIRRFYEHFAVQGYQQYQEFYLPGECHATAEDFQSWLSFREGQDIEILSRFILKSSGQTLSIIQYKMGKNGTYLYGPLAFQKVGDNWYLLNIAQSQELMQVKGFFTYLRPGEFDGIENAASWTRHPDFHTYVGPGGIIDGKSLLDLYPTRYDDAHPGAELSRNLFRPVAEVNPDEAETLLREFRALAENYNISAQTLSRVEKMCREGNYTLAIESIYSESSADNLIEVTQELRSIMVEE